MSARRSSDRSGIMGLTGNAGEELPSKVLDMPSGERLEVVFFEEVINAEAEQLRDDANVVAKVEPF